MRRSKWTPDEPFSLDHYTKVVENISHYEMTTSGQSRVILGLVARGIALWMRKQRWSDEEKGKAAAALAARAEALADRCLEAERGEVGEA